MHTTTGHPSNEALQRLLQQGRATEKATKAAKHPWCSVCACLVKLATVRPAKLPVTPYEFNYLVEMDALEEYTANARLPYRVFMDHARNNLAHVRTQLIERGVHCEFTSLEQHHHLGR